MTDEIKEISENVVAGRNAVLELLKSGRDIDKIFIKDGEWEGSIKKIAAISLLTRSPVTIELSRRAISDVLSGNEPVNITVDRILAAVSRRYGISTEDIKAKKRSADIVNARHICIYLIRQLTDISFNSIGEFFSRDHATIISAFKKVESNVSTSQSFAKEIEELMSELKN